MFKFFSFFGPSQPKKWSKFYLASSTGAQANPLPGTAVNFVLANGEAILTVHDRGNGEGVTAFFNAGGDSLDVSLSMSDRGFSSLKKTGKLDLLVEWRPKPKNGIFSISMVLLGKQHSIEIEFEFQ